MTERVKVKMMKRSRKSERSTHACMVMTWDGTRRTRKNLEPMCDVQEMSVTTQN